MDSHTTVEISYDGGITFTETLYFDKKMTASEILELHRKTTKRKCHYRSDIFALNECLYCTNNRVQTCRYCGFLRKNN